MSQRRRTVTLLALGLLVAGLLAALDWWDDRPGVPEPAVARAAPTPRRVLPTRTGGPLADPPGPAPRTHADVVHDLHKLAMLQTGDGPLTLVCPLLGEAELPDRGLVRMGEEARVALVEPSARGARLWVLGAPASGEAELVLDGLDPLPMRWSDGTCAPILLPGTAPPMRLDVSVHDPRGGDRAVVSGCGLWTRVTPGEVVTTWVPAGEDCLVQAWRLDGPLRALALPEPVVGEAGALLDLEMTLPEFPMAGMGVAFRMEEGAARVAGIHDASPAWEAGLRTGDRILAIDGEPTAGMEDNDFIAFGTGPAGSAAELVVEGGDGAVTTITLERAPLSSDYELVQ